MCTNCCAINNIKRHIIPRLDDLLDELNESRLFSKVDFKSDIIKFVLNQGMNGKNVFKTKFRVYEWLVMPFGLSNALDTFMWIIHDVLSPFIGKFVVTYVYDILIYNLTMEKHQSHARSVL